MRPTLLLALLVGLLIAPLPAQTPTPMGPTEALGFDYFDTEMTNAQVSGFEVQYDGGAWQSLGIPTGVVLSTTQPGAKTYKAIPPFQSGTHSAVFRACNGAGCGGPSLPFAFVFVSSPTVIPTNVRKIPR